MANDGPTGGGHDAKSGEGRTLYVRLSADEASALDAIVAARQAETPERKVSASEVIRGWIRAGGPERG